MPIEQIAPIFCCGRGTTLCHAPGQRRLKRKIRSENPASGKSSDIGKAWQEQLAAGVHDTSERFLTAYQGAGIMDRQNSLRAGERITKATLLQKTGIETPMLVRFPAVAGYGQSDLRSLTRSD